MRQRIATKEQLQLFLERIKRVTFDKGRAYVVDWRVERKKRSLPQNRWYWACLRCISEETGHTEDELHEHFKRTYLPRTVKEILGAKHTMTPSTTTLNTTDFSEYIEHIRVDAGELGIALPDPSEDSWADFVARYDT